MVNLFKFPLNVLNDFILSVGEINEPAQFAAKTLSGLQKLIGFDSGTIYFFNENGKVVNWHLMNVDQRWVEAYLTYYQGKAYALNYGNLGETALLGEPVNWNRVPADEFISDYIQARGLKYSLHFSLQDTHNIGRALFAMDRTRNTPFSDDELDTLRFLIPHLNNLHKKFFLARNAQSAEGDRKQALMKMAGLTKRETEIALWLCSGISPTNISKALRIAPATTHKHITHIYEKLHVSNLQELLVYLLSSAKDKADPAI